MGVLVRLRDAQVLGVGFLLLAFNLSPALAYGGSPWFRSLASGEPAAAARLISNSQFVFGPAVRSFETARYLVARGSPLLPDAGAIEAACAYASVNPQLVLTLLELDGRQVTDGWRSALPQEQREALVRGS